MIGMLMGIHFMLYWHYGKLSPDTMELKNRISNNPQGGLVLSMAVIAASLTWPVALYYQLESIFKRGE